MIVQVKHGVRSRYVAGCRCEECRQAERTYQRKRREERASTPDDQKPHGTARCYVHFGCRCAPCTDAARAAVYANQRKRRSA